MKISSFSFTMRNSEWFYALFDVPISLAINLIDFIAQSASAVEYTEG